MTTTNTRETQDNNLTVASNGNDSVVAISVSDLRKAVDGSASQNLPNFFLKSGLNIMHGERRGIQVIHPNINQTMTRKNPRTKPRFVEVVAWLLTIMLGERRGIHVIHHNTNNITSAEKPIINTTVACVQPSMESSLYALVIHYEIMTASKDTGSHIYGLGSVCTFPRHHGDHEPGASRPHAGGASQPVFRQGHGQERPQDYCCCIHVPAGWVKL